jgi:putative ATPase
MAINYTLSAVQQQGDLQVPLPIRNAPTQLIKKLNYGKDY